MNSSSDRTLFDVGRFGVGQSVPRKEDPTLVRGEGHYTDDRNAENQVHLAFVRSPVAHGTIRAIDLAPALAMAGVVGGWTGADLKAAGYTWVPHAIPFKNRDGTPLHQTERFPFAVDKVRFLGEPVAVIAAETAVAAKDAAEAVELDIDMLPAVVDAAEAVKEDAPRLFEGIAHNTALEFYHGDEAAADAAFAGAAHVARVSLEDSRVIINPLELRAYLATYDPAREHFTLHSPSQGVFALTNAITGVMGLEPGQLTVHSGFVGGSFGMRGAPFPEQIAALHITRAIGRPAKWVEERTPSFLSDNHGRANHYDAALAIDADGRFLAIRINGTANVGAYLTAVGLMPPTRNIVINTCSMYRLPCLEVAVRCVLTNTSPVGPYRGAGRQCGNYIMERLIEEMASVSGIDRIELRRRNQLRPDELPYTAQSGLTYDCGDFTALMDDALDAADYAGFEARRADARARGKLRGIGVGCYLEATAPATKEMGGVRFEADGDVTFITGTLDYGQGHATTFAQILGAELGIPFERIRLLQGDSDELLFGGGTGGSRSVIVSGTAAIRASAEVIERGKALAGWALEAAPGDIEFANGRFTIVGTDREIGLLDLAQEVRAASDLPADLPDTLDVSLVVDEAGVTFPNGCHVCEIEIDEETGAAQIVRYSMVNDIGTVVNPLLLEGQCHGGVMQGIGQALMERVVYDEEGQLLSGSFTDYAMPRADDAPMFEVHHRPTRTASNPLGAKGVGESGCAGSITSVMNALVDALAPVGVRHIDMPATPETLWRAIREARAAA
ncbi:MAG: xanthine dehydrogenase family protein molybdopterin-binding subunit [Acuticoccus sp.]